MGCLFALTLALGQPGQPGENPSATLYPLARRTLADEENRVPVELALYQPDIAQNTGTLLRLGACLGVTLHIIHPTGFPFSRKELKRGGLDYLDVAEFIEHDSYAHFETKRQKTRRHQDQLTTK